MRHAARKLTLAPALLLALAMSSPVEGAHPVPFQGYWTYTHPVPTPIFGTSLLLVRGTFEGTSNLGPFTGEGTFYFDYVTFSYAGTVRWDFARGSLTADVSGQDYPVTTPEGYLTTMQSAFTGGTGQFRGVTGSGAAGGVDNFNPTGMSTVKMVFGGTLLVP
jgi:hypothetical protein